MGAISGEQTTNTNIENNNENRLSNANIKYS